MYGAQQSLALLVDHLPPEEVTPVISVARNPDGPFAQQTKQLANVEAVLTHRRVQWVKHSKRHGLQQLGDWAGLLVQGLTRVPELAKLIRQHHIDVVHTNSIVSLEGPLAARLAGVPHVWHCREMFMVDNPKFQPALPKQLMATVTQRLSDRVVCITKAVQAQFPDGDKTAVIWNPVSIQPQEIKDKPLDTNNLRLGYVGRLSVGKGLLTLLEALALARRQGNGWKLHLFGAFLDEEQEHLITMVIDELQIKDEVHLHGFCTDKAEIFTSMDVMVLPSTNEAFGRVLVEAMSFGVRCVGSNAAAIPEVLIPVFGTQAVFTPEDAADCVRAISDVAAMPLPVEGIQATLNKVSPAYSAQAMCALYADISN
jgi:glycosyltransferase involved in cell wall biosynthesis